MLPVFLSDTRLFEIAWRDGAGPEMPVEAWWGREALSSGFELCIDLLSTDAHLELKQFLGRAVRLDSRLSDGSKASRTGLVRAAQKLGTDGGFARYRLTVVPWIWLLGRGRHNRVFQEKTVMQIVEAVFADYADISAWQWSEEVAGFLADARPRSYCVQYGESDYTFVSRLLAEEGIGWCVEDDKDAPAGHRLRLFADNLRFPEDIVSQSANGGLGIRYHRADSQEDQDSILAFGQHRRLTSNLLSAVSYDYKAKQSISLNISGAKRMGGPNAPLLESYDDPGVYAWANAAEAERYGRLAMEAREARQSGWLGRSTVRSLRPGTCFDLVGLPVDPANPSAEHRYTAIDILHLGINNLNSETIAAVAQRLGQGNLRTEGDGLATDDPLNPLAAPASLPAELLQLAQSHGYGNRFDAHTAHTPWRPQLEDRSGARLNPRPTAPGPMSALVVGPSGETRPNGADELWCDALGRVKIRFHWQQAEAKDDRDSCWMRVLNRQAGAGMGWQWLPRIGQEVLIDFMGGDIDRPVLLGALYNGQGEGGINATPGGEGQAEASDALFDPATDHRPSGQGNTTGGNSPAWHGSAAGGHRHPAALTGFKSKEFGGQGYNQLALDDTDQQQRIQLATTQHSSQLNLGHLIHQADNYRGSFRGTGIELRTDAWGALRAGQGMVITTWAGTPEQPAGDMAPAIALLKQADTLAQTLNQAAATHQTVQLASSLGTQGKNQSKIDEQAAPLKALHTLSRGMVDPKDQGTAQSDAQQKNTGTTDKLPHLTDPAILQSGKAGIGSIAGQSLQFANGEALTLASGEDTNLAVAGKARIHTGQAIGLLAGAIAPGDGNTGIKLIAAKDDIDLQAQSDEMKFLAKKDVKLVSATQYIDFAAAKKIHLAVAGGASITIDGGITVQCPGTITVHASKKSFAGPASQSYGLPKFPESVCKECLLAAMKAASPFAAAQ